MTPPNLKSNDSDGSFHAAKQLVLSILSHRDRSVFEITSKLKEKGFSDPIITELITYLQEIGLLDDADLIRKWSRMRLEHHGFGPIRLRNELLSKGLARDAVDTFIDGLTGEWDPIRLAENALWRKYKNPTALQTASSRRRAFAYLKRKGHRTDAIRSAFKEMTM
ncbi:MAG: regulatory protein RecX [Nitrospiria bacterium]